VSAVVADEPVALERLARSALTSEEDTGDYYERVLRHDMEVVSPGMVLDRAKAVESWMGSVPWWDFEMEDARVVSLDGNAALVTYRAPAHRARDVPRCRALCPSVYRMSDGRWWLVLSPAGAVVRSTPPAGQPDVRLLCTLSGLVGVWLGKQNFSEAARERTVMLAGPAGAIRSANMVREPV
jgi:hypothetical protein